MKNFLVFLLLGGAITAKAQTAASAPTAAKGAASTSTITPAPGIQHYDPAKTYTVIKLWNQKEPLSESEIADLAKLSKQLEPKKVKLLTYEWKTAADLEAFLKQQGITSSVSTNDGIQLKGEHYHYNTTNSSAVFFFTEGVPVRICSGNNCADHVRNFFRIIGTN